jgi:hypothetical protein
MSDERWRPGRFVFDSGANAAGTLVAVSIIYLIGVTSDAIPGRLALTVLAVVIAGMAGLLAVWVAIWGYRAHRDLQEYLQDLEDLEES